MSKQIKELTCKTLLVDVSKYPLNFLIFPHRLTANAYVGCLHDCAYCYARWYCKQDEIKVKINAPEILKKELEKRIAKGKPREPVCFGSISDPYQAIERKYQITRKMLEVCDELSYPVFIVTKSDLAVRDKDVLSSLATRNLVAVNFTITPVREKLLRKMEPRAPPNKKRLEVMKTLTQAGVPCNLYLSPIFPILSDNLLNFYLQKAAQSGARCCSAIFLKIRPVIWNGVKQFLQSNTRSLIKELDSLVLQGKKPDLVAEYEDLYFKLGNKDLSGYSLPEFSYRRNMMESIAEVCKQNSMCFTAEEFLDLWTTPYSDCISIDCWHAPTAYDIFEFINSQRIKNVSKDVVINFIKKNFVLEDGWEKLMNVYWDLLG
ncbi:MAG: radical SAM protein [Candidatus Bathyarchaeia archaeon]|jgi:DNA repair photolyase